MKPSADSGQRRGSPSPWAQGFWAILFGLAVVLALPAQAQQIGGPLLVTYGSDAPAEEGDFDYAQVLYISVPRDYPERFHIRVFDPDSEGEHDLALFPRGDTKTRFALYGGPDAVVAPGGSDGRSIGEAELRQGKLLGETIFDGESRFDGVWTTLASVLPRQGAEVGDAAVFRLVVEGLSGNNGNLYDVAISGHPTRDEPIEGARLWSFAPTVRAVDRSTITELPFVAPDEGDRLTVSTFDAAFAETTLKTPFDDARVAGSSQGNWTDSEVPLAADQLGGPAALTLLGGNELPNDITVQLRDAEGRLLPIAMPPRRWQENRRPLPAPRAAVLANCTAVAFDAGTTRDPDGHALTYHWEFGDGSSFDGPAVVHDYGRYGPVRAVLYVTDASGQVGAGARLPIDLLLKRRPIARPILPSVVAVGESVTLDATQSDLGGFGLAEAVWRINDGADLSGAKVRYVFDQPGDYLVSLAVRDDAGGACDTGTAEQIITVNAAPVAEAGPNRRASVGESVTLDGSRSYDDDGEITAHTWELGDGATAEGAVVSHVYETPGTFVARLKVRDDAGVANSEDLDSTRLLINAVPVAAAGPDRSAAIGEEIVFDAGRSSDADGTIISYAWDFGDGNRSQGQRVRHAYAAPGLYRVNLAVRDDSTTRTGRHEDWATVLVNAPPLADAGPDQHVTASLVQFDGSRSHDPDDAIADYSWDFGDGTSGSGPSPTHVYRLPGTYEVSLRVTDSSGVVRNSDSDSMQVRINAPPIADAGPDLIAAPGEELVLQATGSLDPDGRVTGFEWRFPDGSIQTGRVAAVTFPEPGRYRVALQVQDNSRHAEAVDFDEAIIIVNDPPVADAGPDQLIASGEQATLRGVNSHDRDGKITSYRWDLSHLDEPLIGPEVALIFDQPGVYRAQLTVSDDAGVSNSTATDQTTIFVNARPVAEAGPDVVTDSETVVFDAGGSGDGDGDALSYRWDFGDGTTASGMLVKHSYATGGSFPVVLEVDDGRELANSSAVDTLEVQINRPPIARPGPARETCTGDFVVFDGSDSSDPEGGALRYAWAFGDGETADIVNPTKIFNRPGVFPVELTVRDDSGFANDAHSAIAPITVLRGTQADAGQDMQVCANAEIRFDGSNSYDVDGVVNNFNWDFGDGERGAGERPYHIYRKPGSYKVFLSVDGDSVGQCDTRSTDEILVSVAPGPIPRIDAVAVAPLGQPVTFDASGSTTPTGKITSYSWDLGDGTTGEGVTVEHAYAEPGVYTVSLILGSDAVQPSCRKVETRHVVRVNAPPIADAGEDRLVAVHEEVRFDASGSFDPDGGVMRRVWAFGEAAVDHEGAPAPTGEGVLVRRRFTSPGIYEVILSISDDADVANSTTTDKVVVIVNAPPEPVIGTPAAACAGVPTRLSASGSSDPDGSLQGYLWRTGDEGLYEAAEASHVYQRPGDYSLTLEVDDGSGLANSRAHTTRILHVNAPPMAKAGPDRLVCPRDEVTFDAGHSGDLDDRIVSYRWDFGDGTTAEGPVASHRYAEPGDYSVSLEVRDESGSACDLGIDHARVRVNAPPTADAGGDISAWTGGANDAVILDGRGSGDADGGALTYVWQIDGKPAGSGARIRHRFGAEGTAEIVLTVDDQTGLACALASDRAVATVSER